MITFGDDSASPSVRCFAACLVAISACSLADKPGLLFRGQPVGLLRPVGEIEPGDDAEQHRGDALDDEQPLPALQAHHAVEPEQEARDRRADHGGDGNGDGEGGEEPRAIFCRVPIGEIENDAGEEAGFRDAEQEAQHVEAHLAADDRHRAEMMPQVTMMRAIQRLAPNFSSARLLGTSKMK